MMFRNVMLSLGLCFLYASSTGQITLDATSNLELGQQFDYYNAFTTSNLDIGEAGENKTYDFSSWPMGVRTNSSCVEPTTIDPLLLFPNANRGLIDGNSFSSFYLMTADIFSNYGGYNGHLLVYEDPQDWLRYPMTYGDSFEDTNGGTYTYADGTTAQHLGNTKVTVDGYGKLITPKGVICEEVLRIHLETEYTHTFANGTVQAFTADNYFWWDAHLSVPSFIYSTTTFSDGSQLSSFQYQEKKITSTTTVLKENLDLSIAPNPAADFIQVRYQLSEQSELSITLHNLLGQEVATVFSGSQEAGRQTLNFETSKLAAGKYFVKFVFDHQLSIAEIIIQR